MPSLEEFVAFHPHFLTEGEEKGCLTEAIEISGTLSKLTPASLRLMLREIEIVISRNDVLEIHETDAGSDGVEVTSDRLVSLRIRPQASIRLFKEPTVKDGLTGKEKLPPTQPAVYPLLPGVPE